MSPNGSHPSYFSKIGERTIEAAIQELDERLRDNSKIQLPDLDFDQASKNVVDRLGQGSLYEEHISLATVNYVTQSTPEGADEYPFFIAILHSTLAKRALSRGEREKAWSFVAAAFQFCATTEVIWQLQQLRTRTANRRTSGRKGADERKRRVIRPVQQHLIYLIEEHMPEGGWSNPRDTVSKLEALLWEFIEKSSDEIKSTFSKKNFLNTAESWIEGEDDDVRDAFEKFKYPLKSS